MHWRTKQILLGELRFKPLPQTSPCSDPSVPVVGSFRARTTVRDQSLQSLRPIREPLGSKISREPSCALEAYKRIRSLEASNVPASTDDGDSADDDDQHDDGEEKPLNEDDDVDVDHDVGDDADDNDAAGDDIFDSRDSDTLARATITAGAAAAASAGLVAASATSSTLLLFSRFYRENRRTRRCHSFSRR